MLGYDDEKEEIILSDCGRKDRQTLSYENFKLGINVDSPQVSKPNTICKIRMKSTSDMTTIAKRCLKEKAGNYINPPTSFIGKNGLAKF